MPHRRSRLEICLDVLSIIHKGTGKPTRIMYAANLSFRPLQEILKSLVSQGLIREYDPLERAREERSRPDKRSRRYYEITQKGENVIRYFRGAKELLALEEFNFLKV